MNTHHVRESTMAIDDDVAVQVREVQTTVTKVR